MRLLALLIALGAAACTIDQRPMLNGDGQGPGECTTFADTLVVFSTAAGDSDPDAGMRALGAPDTTTVDVAAGAVLSVGFVGLGGVTDNGDGDDIKVHITAGTGTAAAYVSADDGYDYIYIGDLTDSAPTIDLSKARMAITNAVYVQLVGMSGSLSVDALEAIENTCDN
ncbi:MAG TPA: hypothetical protein VFG83_02720 [Kofleriaceae bacterium]|nr:hypothetical protein [Kofleriaceae bacterium]